MGLAFLNKFVRDPMVTAPALKMTTAEFRAIISPNAFGIPASLSELI